MQKEKRPIVQTEIPIRMLQITGSANEKTKAAVLAVRRGFITDRQAINFIERALREER